MWDPNNIIYTVLYSIPGGDCHPEKSSKIDVLKSLQTLTGWCWVSKDHIDSLLATSERFWHSFWTHRGNRKKQVIFCQNCSLLRKSLRKFLKDFLTNRNLGKNDLFFAIFSMSSKAMSKPFRGCKETINVVLWHPTPSRQSLKTFRKIDFWWFFWVAILPPGIEYNTVFFKRGTNPFKPNSKKRLFFGL